MDQEQKSRSNKLFVVMKRWFSDITLNVILKIIVGKRNAELADCMVGEKSDGWRDTLRDYIELFGMFVASDALPFFRWLDLGGIERKMIKTAKELDHVVQRWLEEHKQKKVSGLANGEEDFMDVMLSSLEGAEQLSNYNADTINKSTCLVCLYFLNNSN